jgi:hypothetical protein
MVRADLDDFVACYASSARAASAGRLSGSAASPTLIWSRATRSTSTSSRSRTMPSTTPICCRRPTKSPPKSWKTWRLRWSGSGKLRRRWGADEDVQFCRAFP